MTNNGYNSTGSGGGINTKPPKIPRRLSSRVTFVSPYVPPPNQAQSLHHPHLYFPSSSTPDISNDSYPYDDNNEDNDRDDRFNDQPQPQYHHHYHHHHYHQPFYYYPSDNTDHGYGYDYDYDYSLPSSTATTSLPFQLPSSSSSPISFFGSSSSATPFAMDFEKGKHFRGHSSSPLLVSPNGGSSSGFVSLRYGQGDNITLQSGIRPRISYRRSVDGIANYKTMAKISRLRYSNSSRIRRAPSLQSHNNFPLRNLRRRSSAFNQESRSYSDNKALKQFPYRTSSQNDITSPRNRSPPPPPDASDWSQSSSSTKSLSKSLPSSQPIKIPNKWEKEALNPSQSSSVLDVNDQDKESRLSSSLPTPKSSWLNDFSEACSICFENRCDFSLPRCQDQFCYTCLKKYFETKIRDSWGLKKVELNCPVCFDHVPIEVAARYIDDNLLQMYKKYNSSRLNVFRFCPLCQEKAFVTTGPSDTESERIAEKDCYKKDVNDLLHESGYSKLRKQYNAFLDKEIDAQAYFDIFYETCKNALKGNDHLTEEIDDLGMDDIVTCIDSTDLSTDDTNYLELKKFCERMISQCDYVNSRVALQFCFLKRYPGIQCGHCESGFCFFCGEASMHENMTCEEHIQNKIQEYESLKTSASLDNKMDCLEGKNGHGLEYIETLKWKLNNSKRCPKCNIFIERDDGCNKMDCLYCGHKFCWQCLKVWSVDCGFYTCQETKTNTVANEVKVESGVPDVQALQMRFSSSS